MFQKLSLLPYSDKKVHNMVDQLHRAKGSASKGVPCLEREAEPASKTSYFVKNQMMNKVPKRSC